MPGFRLGMQPHDGRLPGRRHVPGRREVGQVVHRSEQALQLVRRRRDHVASTHAQSVPGADAVFKVAAATPGAGALS